jgi:hypothetical protein
MQEKFTRVEIETKLNRLKATTSVSVPMGYFMLVKICLQRKKESFSSMINKAVLGELERGLERGNPITKEELIFELKSFKKTVVRIKASEALGLDASSLYEEGDDYHQRLHEETRQQSAGNLNFVVNTETSDRAEFRTKRDIDLYFLETFRRLAERLDRIEEGQKMLGRKLGAEEGP